MRVPILLTVPLAPPGRGWPVRIPARSRRIQTAAHRTGIGSTSRPPSAELRETAPVIEHSGLGLVPRTSRNNALRKESSRGSLIRWKPNLFITYPNPMPVSGSANPKEPPAPGVPNALSEDPNVHVGLGLLRAFRGSKRRRGAVILEPFEAPAATLQPQSDSTARSTDKMTAHRRPPDVLRKPPCISRQDSACDES